MKDDSPLAHTEFADRVVDDALRFAHGNRTATRWVEWAQKLSPDKRAVFEAIRVNTRSAETVDDESAVVKPHLPTLQGLSHELRNMLNEAFTVWDAGKD